MNHEIREELLNTLDFRLYRCGISDMALPYRENTLSYPYGYISQCRLAGRGIRFQERPPLWMEPGSTVIIPPGIRHSSEVPKTASQERAVFHWAHFQFFVMGALDIFSFFELPLVLYGEDADYFGDRIAGMVRAFDEPGPSPLESAVAVKKSGFEILEKLLRIAPMKENHPLNADAMLRKITPALNHIRRNLSAKITVAELAYLTRMSLTRFHVAFKEVMGISPMEYVIRERLKESQRLLWSTELAIDEIAMRCGYEDRFFFSKSFRRHLGVTPAECRRRFRQWGKQELSE